MKKLSYLFFLIATIINAQQHEPQKWKKLKSRYANIIFKIGQKKDAQIIANTIDYIQKNNHQSMGSTTQKVDIVLRANTAESNGFVTVSPFRSEFFNTTPPAFNTLGSTNWISTLAIHEYRHVQQFLNQRAGFTKFLYWLIGESGWGLGNVLTIPDWYFEGDAVIMETALSQSGRGRLPRFTALQRALYKDEIFYSYQKVRNGSYQSLVPNQYVTGYQFLNYYRNHFDASKLGDIAKKASSFSIPFYSFSGQMKKETGFKTKEIYQKSVDFNQQLWQQKRDSLGVFQYKSLSVKSKIVALYSFPQIMGNGNIIALKNTLDEIPTFYEIDKKGKETEISKAIINVDRYFNYNLQKIVYTGLSNHPRYNLSTYSDLYLYDIKLKKQKRLTHKKRYFSPSFNYNNTKIIATENNHANSKIIVLNTAGEILKSIQINGFVSRPKFLNSEEYVFIKQLNHKLAIFKMNKNSLKQFQLTPWTSHTIDDLSVSNNNIYYSASYNGIDNIYSLAKHQNNYQITQLTNASIGAYQPFVKNNSLYFIEPISKGSKISCTKVKITPFTYQEPVNMDWDHQKTINFEGGSILNKIATTKHPIQTYTSIFEDLKFHDWTYSIGQQSAKATINATNLLNDFGLAASTDFLFNENNSFNITVTGSYKKWFPIYSLTTEYNYRNLDSQAIINDVKVLGTKSFNDISIEPNVTLPLSQIHGNYNSNFLANFGYQYNKRFNSYFNTNTQKLSSKDFEFSVINTQIVYNSLRRTARKTIGNKAGISINLKYSKGLNQVLNDDYISTQNHLFLPGLSKTHNSYVTLAYQQNKLRKGDVFMYARGFKTLLAKEIYKISYTYQLPLFYPDFGLYGITYFKRIRTNLFADYSKLTLFNSLKTNQNSIGFEIIFDNTFFNIGQAEISLGYRGSYLISKDIQAPNTQYSSGFVLRTTAF